MDNYFAVFKYFFHCDEQLCLIELVGFIIIFLGDDKEAGNGVEDRMYPLVSSGCSPPLVLFAQLGVIFVGEESCLMESSDKLIFDGVNITLFLVLHTIEILAIVAEKDDHPNLGHADN